MMSCDDARILGMDEITEWDGKTMWLLQRGKMTVCPVIYEHEHIPFLVFREMANKDAYPWLRPELMGKEWVMFDKKPVAKLRWNAFRKDREEQAG